MRESSGGKRAHHGKGIRCDRRSRAIQPLRTVGEDVHVSIAYCLKAAFDVPGSTKSACCACWGSAAHDSHLLKFRPAVIRALRCMSLENRELCLQVTGNNRQLYLPTIWRGITGGGPRRLRGGCGAELTRAQGAAAETGEIPLLFGSRWLGTWRWCYSHILT